MLAASPGSRRSSAEGGGSTGVFGVRFPAEKIFSLRHSIHIGPGTDPVIGYQSPSSDRKSAV